ncbi:GNAT family N-acetyltransferase [Thermoflexus sp.]|uniref:GNAT family N-acetyltransferase n=1 Tax=Thermoflexus sp. TaxID=1969742 RepID=UPI002ADE2F80|nr:GNAT family N-acetyltransferase [Thermoflexus sp.]
MKVTIRRARPADVDAIRDLVRRATRGRLDPSADEVFDRMAERGMLLAFNPERELIGLVSWRVENLVARVLDFLVHPLDLRPAVGRQLIEAVEEEARRLECEACLIYVSPEMSSEALAFYIGLGYTRWPEESLSGPWREAAHEFDALGRVALIKQIRAERVTQPI